MRDAGRIALFFPAANSPPILHGTYLWFAWAALYPEMELLKD